jgi:hypothetical protein
MSRLAVKPAAPRADAEEDHQRSRRAHPASTRSQTEKAGLGSVFSRAARPGAHGRQRPACPGNGCSSACRVAGAAGPVGPRPARRPVPLLFLCFTVAGPGAAAAVAAAGGRPLAALSRRPGVRSVTDADHPLSVKELSPGPGVELAADPGPFGGESSPRTPPTAPAGGSGSGCSTPASPQRRPGRAGGGQRRPLGRVELLRLLRHGTFMAGLIAGGAAARAAGGRRLPPAAGPGAGQPHLQRPQVLPHRPGGPAAGVARQRLGHGGGGRPGPRHPPGGARPGSRSSTGSRTR